MRHDIREIRREFEEIREILRPTDFDGFLRNACHISYENFREWRERYWDCVNGERCEANERIASLDCNSGCTRMVLSLPNSNYVFKIQYDTSDEVDYCRNECFVYHRAVERGCEEYFAWIDCLGEYGSALVYVMEKVEVNEDRNSEDSYTYHARKWEEGREDREDDEDDEFDGEYDDHEGMIEFAIAHNGGNMEEAAVLIWDLGVNDLHSANWGYRGDVLVAVDYGGYGEDAYAIARLANEE